MSLEDDDLSRPMIGRNTVSGGSSALISSRAWRDAIVILLTTRVPLFLIAWLATFLLASGDAAQPGNLQYLKGAPRALQAWVHWDAQWYLLIAERGYGALQEDPEMAPRNRPEDTAGFFPLYPGAVRALRIVLGGGTGTLVAALLVSNGALLGFLALLHGWTSRRWGEEAARGACIAACTFPTSLFLSAPYSESLFLLLALGAVVSSGRDRHLLAGVLAAAAALTRPVGLLLALPLAWRALERDANGRRRWEALAAAAGAPLGVAAYALFCRLQFGDPFAFAARQVRWRGSIGPPWYFLQEFLQDPHVHGQKGSVIDLTVALLCLAALVPLARRLGAGLTLYTAAACLLPLSTGLFSFSRLALAAFPLFILIGIESAERPRLRLAYLALALPFSGLFTALYASGWWVG